MFQNLQDSSPIKDDFHLPMFGRTCRVRPGLCMSELCVMVHHLSSVIDVRNGCKLQAKFESAMLSLLKIGR